MELRLHHWSTTRKSHLETRGFTYWQHTNYIPNKQLILIMHLKPQAILCNPSSFIFHVDFIPSHSSKFGDIELHLIPIPCHQCNIIAHTEFMTTYITNHFIEIACQDLSKFIIHNPWIPSLMQNHSYHIFNITIIIQASANQPRTKKQPNITLPSPNSLLRLKGLAQMRDSRSGEPLLPRRELEKGNSNLTRDLA